MKAVVKSKNGDSVKIEVTVKLDKSSMLKSEDNIRDALNDAGCLAAECALKQFDTDGSPIMVGNTKLTSRGKIHNTYQSPWGEIGLERHVYQTSKGGRQFCPLEKDARIVLTATPGFAKLVSYKYAEMGSSRALFDLKESHGRPMARSYLKALADAVGAVAQAKEEKWEFAPPKLEKPVKSVAIGIDGTCMLMTEDGWREAMVGTISLFDRKGERLHTIQLGATPEYGKKTFYERFERELELIKERYPKATYIGIADGAKGNWSYLSKRTDKQTIDFWHASGYLGKAAEAMFPGKRNEDERKEWLDEACHKLKHKVGAAARIHNEMQEHLNTHRMTTQNRQTLQASVTYFANHKSRMKYAQNQADNLPIGSGVTEAACKTLVKQRLCNSGMRWKEQGAQAVLSLRSLAHTDCRWDQFWRKIDQYGFELAA